MYRNMFTTTLAEMVTTLDARFEALGWDQPAVLAELHMETINGVNSLIVRSKSLVEGHPVAWLLEASPTLDPEAVGAVLVTEGWSYGPDALAQVQAGREVEFAPFMDPDRREVRCSHLVLCDGTELLVRRERGRPPVTIVDPQTDGWLSWLLRCVAQVPSDAPGASVSLARRAVLVWQLAQLGALSEAGADLGPAPGASAWGRFTLPDPVAGLAGEPEPWWGPIAEAAVSGRRLKAGECSALVRALRRGAATGPLPLIVALPLERYGGVATLTGQSVGWLDDDLLIRYIDDTLPTLDQLAEYAEDLGPGWSNGLV